MNKALVIDDARAVRLILSKALNELGFETREAANGKEAIEVMESQETPVDFALVDWNMPEMTGLEFVTRVRANPAWNNVLLMMVTTESEIGQVCKALEAGANEYMMKPFTREAVEDKLRLLGVIP